MSHTIVIENAFVFFFYFKEFKADAYLSVVLTTYLSVALTTRWRPLQFIIISWHPIIGV